MTSSFWFKEEVTVNHAMSMRLQKIILDQQSEFQRVQIIETNEFGTTLVLDGKTQSALRDEFIYHECLVHPAMLLHPNPKKVYIGGGGELATAREALRHKSVERVVMCDLDKMVVDVSMEHLPEWNAGCHLDPRLELAYGDAHAWLLNNDEQFDVIIMDIADPIEAGPGYILYTEEFYKYAMTRLTPGGVLVTQSGPGSNTTHGECFTAIHNTLKQAFPTVIPYTVSIPSFGCDWAFNVASIDSGVDTQAYGVGKPMGDLDEEISKRIDGELKFYDGVSHVGIFGTPKYIRAALAADKRVITKDNPVFMY
uniref:thermospermine synthase n=1 Tax=Fibrocapsa japonica TaxID=94617 RepID=A0A7S2V6Z8_9STRA